MHLQIAFRLLFVPKYTAVAIMDNGCKTMRVISRIFVSRQPQTNTKENKKKSELEAKKAKDKRHCKKRKGI